MSMRENENGNGQAWNACPIRLGCMSNSMNEKESEVGWKLPWILKNIQGVPQAKVSDHGSLKSLGFGLALVFLLCLLPLGNSPGQAWSWHKCGNGFQNAVAGAPFTNTFFFFLSWRYAKHILMACHYAQTIISHLLSISREPGLSHRPRQGEKHSFATVATEVLCPPSIT